MFNNEWAVFISCEDFKVFLLRDWLGWVTLGSERHWLSFGWLGPRVGPLQSFTLSDSGCGSRSSHNLVKSSFLECQWGRQQMLGSHIVCFVLFVAIMWFWLGILRLHTVKFPFLTMYMESTRKKERNNSSISCQNLTIMLKLCHVLASGNKYTCVCVCLLCSSSQIIFTCNYM